MRFVAHAPILEQLPLRHGGLVGVAVGTLGEAGEVDGFRLDLSQSPGLLTADEARALAHMLLDHAEEMELTDDDTDSRWQTVVLMPATRAGGG